jgi:hypothetical protein
MHFGGGVFSQGGFTFWVILEMVWAVSGGIVIIVLPAYETIRDMRESRKQLMMATSERRLRNGNTISCEFVEKTEKQRLVDRHLLPAPGAAPKNEEAVDV